MGARIKKKVSYCTVNYGDERLLLPMKEWKKCHVDLVLVLIKFVLPFSMGSIKQVKQPGIYLELKL